MTSPVEVKEEEGRMPARVRRKVDLPDPDGPRIPRVWPEGRKYDVGSMMLWTETFFHLSEVVDVGLIVFNSP